MKKSMFALIALLALSLAACNSSPKKADAASEPAHVTPSVPQSVEDAVKSDFRSPRNKARDVYRHPVETLKFFGVTPEMTVVEIAPSGGWYAQILIPLLSQKGHYIAAENLSGGEHPGLRKDFTEWLAQYPQFAGNVEKVDFSPPQKVTLAKDNSVDMILTFRNVHNWMKKHGDEAAFKGFFKALKPGGILGVVEHRAFASHKTNPDSGYLQEKYVLKLAKKAGFKLVEKSEINANPNDLKDYPEGVWTLPPNFAAGEKDKAKYQEIGESDRMTLKFQKP